MYEFQDSWIRRIPPSLADEWWNIIVTVKPSHKITRVLQPFSLLKNIKKSMQKCDIIHNSFNSVMTSPSNWVRNYKNYYIIYFITYYIMSVIPEWICWGMIEAVLFYLLPVWEDSDTRISSLSHAVYGMFYRAPAHRPPLCDQSRHSNLPALTVRPGSTVSNIVQQEVTI